MYFLKMLPMGLLITLKHVKCASTVILSGIVVKSLNVSSIMPYDGMYDLP